MTMLPRGPESVSAISLARPPDIDLRDVLGARLRVFVDRPPRPIWASVNAADLGRRMDACLAEAARDTARDRDIDVRLLHGEDHVRFSVRSPVAELGFEISLAGLADPLDQPAAA